MGRKGCCIGYISCETHRQVLLSVRHHFLAVVGATTMQLLVCFCIHQLLHIDKARRYRHAATLLFLPAQRI